MTETPSQPQGPVLVTGANGHLGRRLLIALAGAREVRAVVRSERAAAQVRPALKSAGGSLFVLDYADAEALTRAASGCSHAVHLVGILKEGRTSSYRVAHEAATTALCRAADAAGLARVVYLSIVGSRPGSRNACLASKGRAEEILLGAKTPALVLRVPMVLGEGDFASRALRRQALAAFARGGRSLEQPIYAGDVVQALVRGISEPGLDDAALDLAGPESIPRRELVERAARLYDRRPRFAPIPAAFNHAAAAVLERVSKDPPLTRAMLGVLEHDDDVDVDEAVRRLGIELTPLDETLRRCVGPETRP